jgi:hypothetical protein
MVIAAAPEAAEVGAAASSAGESAANKGSKGASIAGLGAAAQALPKPKTEHPYIVGLILITIGVAGMIGSVTGSLPAMLAALFDPNVLVDKSDRTPGSSIGSDIIGYLKLSNPLNAPQELIHELGGPQLPEPI